MPRRNLRWLLVLVLVSLVCHRYVPASRFSRALAANLDVVASRYYRPVNDLDLFEDAMGGMLSPKHLDKYSKYFPPAEQDKFENEMNQEFVGIGILPRLDPETKQLVVLSPVPDGPAFAAGIRGGDRIERIEGQSTKGMSLKDAAKRIYGAPNTPVTIGIRHPGSDAAVDLTIVRRVVHEDTVKGATRGRDGRWNFLLPGNPKLGYVHITSFTDTDGSEKCTSGDLRKALEELRKKKVRGVVIDLRDNPGGSLRSAVEICDMLLPKGEIVETHGREQQVLRAYRASGDAPFGDLPLAVLVNDDTASAAEIVSACLQDNGRAVVVGERTYGKGTVQEVFELGPPFGAMKLTIATYWRPNGKDINRPPGDAKDAVYGVSPNEGCEVRVSDADREKLLQWQEDRELANVLGEKPASAEVPDRVLQRAVECLNRP